MIAKRIANVSHVRIAPISHRIAQPSPAQYLLLTVVSKCPQDQIQSNRHLPAAAAPIGFGATA